MSYFMVALEINILLFNIVPNKLYLVEPNNLLANAKFKFIVYHL